MGSNPTGLAPSLFSFPKREKSTVCPKEKRLFFLTERLYLNDSYLREFDARVVSVSDEKFFVFDKTAFYPQGGGQPCDTGKIVAEDGASHNVVFVKGFGNDVSHQIENCSLKAGDKIHGVIDWQKRFALMRAHTAAHILHAVILKETGALITGNQLGEKQSRMDFEVTDFDRELLSGFEKNANDIISAGLPVSISFLPREQALAMPELCRLKDVAPKDLPVLRIVKIGDFDCSLDGGTHVANTREVKGIKITKLGNKGAANRRIYFEVFD